MRQKIKCRYISYWTLCKTFKRYFNAKCLKLKMKKKIKAIFFATLQEQLDYLRFPLGNFLKSEIRDMAKILIYLLKINQIVKIYVL